MQLKSNEDASDIDSIGNTVIGKNISVLSEYILGDMTARYIADSERHIGLWLYPAGFDMPLAQKRETLDDECWAHGAVKGRIAMAVEPLVHIKISGDDQPGEFGGGRTMKWAPSNERFQYIDQRIDNECVTTTFKDCTGLCILHKLEKDQEGAALKSVTSFTNGSTKSVRLELLTSFSIGGITPYDTADAGGRLIVHRFRSAWSAEGRLVSEPVENLSLERTWAGKTHLSERFGQIGSMPARGWFPTALVEDVKAGVIWGARMEAPVSWQIEVGRRHDDLVLSGGLADREFGHWTKTIQPGESFSAPVAWITCVAGSVDEACERLVSVDISSTERLPKIEQDLPIIYNDWCTSWGDPREELLISTAKKVADLGVRYFVIDAGWYTSVDKNAKWSTTFGDWEEDRQRFPNGIKETARKINEFGLIPGIWFEPEYVARDSEAFTDTAHLLTRDGIPLTIGVRRAWNLSDPYAFSYIDSRVIEFLRESGFGYLKMDHSETLGIGVDHSDGLGEGLRCQGEGTLHLLEHIKEMLPELIIEITSAGGNRLEASILQRSAMSSFSDAHEVVEIPIIAASMHRLILPRQSQIWAVLHASDSKRRIDYSLAAAFLGRMCLSGEIIELNQEQMEQIKKAVDLYKKAVPVIKYGSSRIIERRNPSWRHPKGWQAVIRVTENRGMIVIHTFEGMHDDIYLQLPGEGWKIVDSLASSVIDVQKDKMHICEMPEFSGQVFLLEKD